jgi:hypothetical protein
LVSIRLENVIFSTHAAELKNQYAQTFDSTQIRIMALAEIMLFLHFSPFSQLPDS